jgi:hypothetical protein
MNASSSTFDALEPAPRERKRILFDPTINLGHVLTFIGFVVLGFAAWGNIDKRQTLTEAQVTAVIERSSEQDKRMSESFKELKQDVKDVQRAVNDINRTLAIVAPGKR